MKVFVTFLIVMVIIENLAGMMGVAFFDISIFTISTLPDLFHYATKLMVLVIVYLMIDKIFSALNKTKPTV
ncbi:hypothetical protein [uncultured Alteromonas sp.]|jgi:hypothetical protein|uniref:hypothetical protein n=1 Tax=uncultured Alteromonas sp. TaxID=179113 RepID=UPI0025E5F4C8|nr:hypothetical protein [uncultured Alteromonas sp.]